MARKEKLTLDYFPHYAVQGDISNIIQEKYGNDGYAVLYKNYEQFCLRDRQYIDLSEFVTLASISAYCKISEDKYREIVETLVQLGAYDKEIWDARRIIISEKFIENTKDAYRKRVSKCIDFQDLKNFFLQKSTCNEISNSENQQIKLNKIKENKTKKALSTDEYFAQEEESKIRISKTERDILKAYCKRLKVRNTNAYIRKLIDNGDYLVILEEERLRMARLEEAQKQEKIQKQLIVENPQLMEKAMENARKVVRAIKQRG